MLKLIECLFSIFGKYIFSLLINFIRQIQLQEAERDLRQGPKCLWMNSELARGGWEHTAEWPGPRPCSLCDSQQAGLLSIPSYLSPLSQETDAHLSATSHPVKPIPQVTPLTLLSWVPKSALTQCIHSSHESSWLQRILGGKGSGHSCLNSASYSPKGSTPKKGIPIPMLMAY
jgi:hypothetical protein